MKKSELKLNPLSKLIKNSLMDLPSPSSITYLWNMGFLLGFTLILQMTSGLLISMHYTPMTTEAYSSVIHMMRDVDSGFITRLMHVNGASMFFILAYSHMIRGMYFISPINRPKVWYSGIGLLVLLMATSFLGYVLPWGQMSFWGASVITSLFSAIPLIGGDLVKWLWGNFSVSQPTLNRFFSLHFLLPFLIVAMTLVHLIFLHEKGSSNPLGTNLNLEKMKFHPLFSYKDLLPFIWLIFLINLLITKSPDLLGDVENMNPANPLATPLHIQPEWYFLFAYAILRSIPSKLGGVVALFSSILVLFAMPFLKQKNSKFSPLSKVKMWSFVSICFILTWIGANSVEPPYEIIGKIFSAFYFGVIFFA